MVKNIPDPVAAGGDGPGPSAAVLGRSGAGAGVAGEEDEGLSQRQVWILMEGVRLGC